MEPESIRSRAGSTGGCVKLKTVTDITNRDGAVPVIMFIYQRMFIL